MKEFDALNKLSLVPMEKIENPTQEWWFTENWIPEAIAAGFIIKFVPEEEIPSFPLFDGFSQHWKEEKTIYKGTARETIKVLTHERMVLRPTIYTPDGIIHWAEKAYKVLFDDVHNAHSTCYFKAQRLRGKWVTILDVKAPTGTNRHSDTPFSFTRKWMWQRHKLYVTKVMLAPPPKGKKKSISIPKGYLFNETWTPRRYFMTEKMTKKRTLHYTSDGIWGFLHKLKNPTEK